MDFSIELLISQLRPVSDMALVGFDDLPSSLIIDPFLTVAAQPAYHMGQQATKLLLARLSNQNTAPHQEIVLPTEIIMRRSSSRSPRPEQSN